jgi:exosortase A-associated hydrolase 1
MGETMRRLLTFDCEDARLGASLDGGGGSTGLLFVSGGTQTRVGSHRMFERLAFGLAAAGYACLRFDRRGIGDSEGEDPGFRGSGADIAAAAAALRAEADVRRVFGLGLCDGATALALSGGADRVDGLVLINPWLVEAESGDPAPAAVRRHYRERLTSAEGWKKLLTGSLSWRKLLRGIGRTASVGYSPLAAQVAQALRQGGSPAELVLARDDATAAAAARELKHSQFKDLIAEAQIIPSSSHTFARPLDAASLLDAALTAVRRLEARARP